MANQGTPRGPAQLDASYHYPPELLTLLVDTIPRLCRSKRDVLLFFHGAGVNRSFTSKLYAQVNADRDSIRKSEIAREVLVQLNEDGDRSLAARREVVKRVVEFEEFSTCWEDDRLIAQGLVAQVRQIVNVKDSFTRINQERVSDARKHQESKRAELKEIERRNAELEGIKRDFYKLFSLEDAQRRGLLLEDVLNRLFRASGILVREAFARVGEPGEGVLEQIDGVIEIDGQIYLVEMKWLKKNVGLQDVSQHLGRILLRGDCKGIIISYTDYTPAAINECKNALTRAVVVLSTLQEFVSLLEGGDDLTDFLKSKIRSAIIDRKPFAAA